MSELLTDPMHTRGDLRQIESAVRKGWKIPDAIFEKAALVIAEIMAKGSNREKVAAARVLVAMNEQNGPSDRRPQINVGVQIDLESRRDRTLAIAERIRAGRVLERDSGGSAQSHDGAGGGV